MKLIHFAVVAVLCGACGCTTVRDATRLEEMDEAEYEAYTSRVALQVGAVARATLAEGDLDAEFVARVASVLRGLVLGGVAAGGTLIEALELDSYSALALVFALSELDAQLAGRGAYGEGGILSPRAIAVLLAVADAIEAAAFDQPPG